MRVVMRVNPGWGYDPPDAGLLVAVPKQFSAPSSPPVAPAESEVAA